MFIWIFSIILVLIACVVYSIVKKAVTKTFELKSTDLSTPLNEFKESNTIGTRLFSHSVKLIENISTLYERMCVTDPLSHKDDPRLPSVIDQYKRLLSGKLADPEGRHVPSEYLGGKRNPDYETYMEGQRKALGKTVALNNEIRRLKTISEEDDLRTDFIISLFDMGLPAEVTDALVSDDKLNSFKAEDWKRLATAVKGYLKHFDEGSVADFLREFNELPILLDEDKLDTFNTFRLHKAPIEIVKEIVRGRISMDQGVRITKLVVNEDYPWEEAMEEVLEEDQDKASAEELRQKYNKAVHG